MTPAERYDAALHRVFVGYPKDPVKRELRAMERDYVIAEIEAAVLAERQRCAAIARDERKQLRNGGARNACMAVAQRIEAGP